MHPYCKRCMTLAPLAHPFGTFWTLNLELDPQKWKSRGKWGEKDPEVTAVTSLVRDGLVRNRLRHVQMDTTRWSQVHNLTLTTRHMHCLSHTTRHTLLVTHFSTRAARHMLLVTQLVTYYVTCYSSHATRHRLIVTQNQKHNNHAARHTLLVTDCSSHTMSHNTRHTLLVTHYSSHTSLSCNLTLYSSHFSSRSPRQYLSHTCSSHTCSSHTAWHTLLITYYVT